MINTLQDMEKARQEMKRKAFLVELEGRGFNFTDKSHDEFGFNDETLNMVWEMWQAAQEQMLQNRYENLANDDYMLMPTELTDEIAEAIAYSANCCGGIAYDIYQAIIQSLKEVS